MPGKMIRSFLIVNCNQNQNMNKVRWGILSTAKIGREKVIPAMQAGAYTVISAIASRNKEAAEETARSLNIPIAFGSYEELLNSPDIDAVYIPLPNHLHVEWTIKALEREKHVLCEKPIGLSSAEAEKLLIMSKAKPQLKVMEAFMYRFHPQWQQAKKLVDEGAIGQLKTIQSFFSYYNDDPANIRNQKGAGGGGLMDIGCYCISLSRFLFACEPQKVFGAVEYDPQLGTDRMASGILQFEKGSATFTCSTQLMAYQRVHVLGTTGCIEIEIPFNAPPDKITRIWLHQQDSRKEITLDRINQYTIQGDLFSKAILDDTIVPTPLKDAVNNMRVIEAVLESAKQGRWI